MGNFIGAYSFFHGFGAAFPYCLRARPGVCIPHPPRPPPPTARGSRGLRMPRSHGRTNAGDARGISPRAGLSRSLNRRCIG